MHGWGTLHFPNGNKHVGNWVHNVKTGQGVFTWRNGDQYEGQFKDGKISEVGTMKYSNGTIQKDTWPNGAFLA